MLAVTRISEGHGARMAESLKFLVVMGLGIFNFRGAWRDDNGLLSTNNHAA